MNRSNRLLLQKSIPYLFLLPAIVALLVTIFLPAIQAFSLSFSQYDYDLTQLPRWVGLTNFQRLARDLSAIKEIYQL